MGRFVFGRVLSIIPTMFIIVTLSFFMMRLAPGGPFSSEKEVPIGVMENLLKKYHMDESLPRQYVRFLGDVLRGDLGPSFKNKDFTVNDLIASSLPNSLILGLTSLLFALIMGVLVVPLFVGLMVLGVRYALVLAFLVALLDALPVFGSSMVLLPWALWSLLIGDYFTGVGLIVLFLVC